MCLFVWIWVSLAINFNYALIDLFIVIHNDQLNKPMMKKENHMATDMRIIKKLWKKAVIISKPELEKQIIKIKNKFKFQIPF